MSRRDQAICLAPSTWYVAWLWTTTEAAGGALSHDGTRTRVHFLSRAATAQMRAGDAEAGAATGHEVLTLVNGIQSARLHDRLRTTLGEAGQLTSAKSLRTLLERGHVLLNERAAA